MHVTDLGGHSGCRILLCEGDDNKTFVRKISSGPSYNARLMAQAEKQQAFRGGTVGAPAVYGTGTTSEGLFYFDMEYIQGITLAELMKSLEIGRVRGVAECLVSNMRQGAKAGEEPQKAFLAKIASVEKRLCGRGDAFFEEAMTALKRYDWSAFTASSCHGDMTLENIIVKDGRLYLIDFLDSFFDSFLLDIATLMQDVQLMWAYRHQKSVDINTLLRLMVFRDVLVDEVGKAEDFTMQDIWHALLLKVMRIYPYAKDEATLAFLHARTASILDSIRRGALCAR